jgi:hypothetical protein
VPLRIRPDGVPRLILVPNRVDRRTLEGQQLVDELTAFGEHVSSPIGYRTAFIRAFSSGLPFPSGPESRLTAKSVPLPIWSRDSSLPRRPKRDKACPTESNRRTLEGQQLVDELTAFGEYVSPAIGDRAVLVRAVSTGFVISKWAGAAAKSVRSPIWLKGSSLPRQPKRSETSRRALQQPPSKSPKKFLCVRAMGYQALGAYWCAAITASEGDVALLR